MNNSPKKPIFTDSLFFLGNKGNMGNNLDFKRNISVTQVKGKKVTGNKTALIVATFKRSDYSSPVHQKADELALVGYKLSLGAQSARAFFVCNISMRSHVMAELERDTFGCAGNLVSLSTNPFRLRHHHLVVIDEASKSSLGAH